MTISVYADGRLLYDSRVAMDPRHSASALLALTVTTGLNKGGTAGITMGPEHPFYGQIVSYKTIIEIYRDSSLLFRGRALYPSDDFYGRRAITCEGERCFLADAVLRPYLYQDTPQVIFSDVIAAYNSQVETGKQFDVGSVTVTDPNDYVRLESESAEPISEVVDKLVARCGGYITFSTDSDGHRCIHWLAELNYSNNQTITFGENLLDFARSGSNTALATRIIPYGAKDEETGQRITIESVNDGLDYVQDDDAVALRGTITASVTWDDVTLPANLITKAQQYLASSKLFITSLSLTALDLSVLGVDIDSLRVGDLVRVYSPPHGVDDHYLLTDRTFDLLNPGSDRVTMGKDVTTLTGADVAGDRHAATDLQQVQQSIKADYTRDVAQVVEQTTATLSSLIQQTADAIMAEVSATYATNGELDSLVSSKVTQLADSITFEFDQLRAVMDEADEDSRERLDELTTYIRMTGSGQLILGRSDSPLTLVQQNDRISFLDNGAEVAYISNRRLYITAAQLLSDLIIGDYAWTKRANNHVSFVRVLS